MSLAFNTTRASNGVMTSRTWSFAKFAAFTAFPILPLLAPIGYYTGWPWLSALFVFVAVPILDWLIGPDRSPPVGAAAPRIELTWLHAVPRMYVFLWFGTLVWAAVLFTTHYVPAYTAAWLLVSVAANSAFATCVAHELLHWPAPFDRALARLIMATVAYGHFPIEHLHHHRTVGIVREGTTPPLGQSVWAFVARNVLFTSRSAWRIERGRQLKDTLQLFQNSYVQQWALTTVIVALFAELGGAWGLALFVVQAVGGIFTTEYVNYAQHYGLARNPDAPVCGSLSWSSNGLVTNAFTLNITRHADHHLRPGVPYYQLEHLEAMPLLPNGYLALFFPAMIPALWRRIMDPRAQKFAR